MSGECANTPLKTSPTQLRALRAELTRELARRPSKREPVRPLNAYAVAFGESPHAAIRRRVAFLYSGRSRVDRKAPERGHVYVFRDRRDEPASLVKLGSSVRVPRRMAEWRRELEARPDELALLYSFESAHVRLAEAVLHALLFCQWRPKRVSRRSGRRLLEYFAVADWAALRQLCAAVARHVDWTVARRYKRLAGSPV